MSLTEIVDILKNGNDWYAAKKKWIRNDANKKYYNQGNSYQASKKEVPQLNITKDSFLKRLPEVEYVQWGKYILKSRNQ